MVESLKEERPLVLITGITGYLGSAVAHLFLKDGRFRVRGTVRDLNNKKKLAPVMHYFGNELFNKMELVEASLQDEASLFKAVKGCTYVLHVASPIVITQPKDANVLIKPAVEGTLNICRACHKEKVKRLVMTSSSAAIKDPIITNRNPILTEEDWSEVENNPNITAYGKSKTLAERAAWEYQAKMPEKERFELVTLCPSFISGPAMCQPGYSTSEGLKTILLSKFPVMKLYSGMVDIRDVA